MKKEFSKHWKSSKQPRKQRKYKANAPLHIKKKFVSVTLSKDLRKKTGRRNAPARKGDLVRVLRGKFKKKQGKINEVFLKKSRIAIDGLQIKKQDGSKVNVKLHPSNLQILELNLEDRKRQKKLGTKPVEKKPAEKTKEKNKNETKKDSKKETTEVKK